MLAITQQTFGGPDVLELVDVERPRRLPTDALVRVHAVGVNPVEAMIRSGVFPLLGPPPFGLGWDLSGVVEEVGPGHTRLAPGDEVYGMPWWPRPAAAYAQFVSAPTRMFARKPVSLSHAEAAAVPLVGLTAWQALVEAAEVAPGQTVLVHGAGGGVGHLAVQLARHLGARVVGTAGAAKHDFVRSLGADQVIDYRTQDFAAEVRDADVVLDLIGNGYAERSIDVLKPGGVLVTAVQHLDAGLAQRVRAAGRRFAGVAVESDVLALARLGELIDKGVVRPHVDRVFPLAEAPAAHAAVEAGHTTGRVVLSVP